MSFSDLNNDAQVQITLNKEGSNVMSSNWNVSTILSSGQDYYGHNNVIYAGVTVTDLEEEQQIIGLEATYNIARHDIEPNSETLNAM